MDDPTEKFNDSLRDLVQKSQEDVEIVAMSVGLMAEAVRLLYVAGKGLLDKKSYLNIVKGSLDRALQYAEDCYDKASKNG